MEGGGAVSVDGAESGVGLARAVSTGGAEGGDSEDFDGVQAGLNINSRNTAGKTQPNGRSLP